MEILLVLGVPLAGGAAARARRRSATSRAEVNVAFSLAHASRRAAR